jgi:hypothetical protein
MDIGHICNCERCMFEIVIHSICGMQELILGMNVRETMGLMTEIEIDVSP